VDRNRSLGPAGADNLPTHSPRTAEVCAYKIDRSGVISWVNDAWLSFARENGWAVARQDVIGTKLTTHIADLETRYLHSLIAERMREQHRPLRLDFRCDSPTRRRFMRMEIIYDRFADEIEYRSWLLREEVRAPVALLDSRNANRADTRLAVCGWCNRVEADGRWVEVEVAVDLLGLFGDSPLPQLQHVICPMCSLRLREHVLTPVRVLVLDDDPDLAAPLLDQLRSMGHAADSAGTLASGLELFARREHDIVIVDLASPQATGLAFLEAVKEWDANHRTIVLTGFPLSGTWLARLADLQVGEVLNRPFNLGDILGAIKRLLARGGLEQGATGPGADGRSRH
jgi:ActR/RegA family two-component response regulator